MSRGVVCRRCHREVDVKYGGPGTVAVPRRHRITGGAPDFRPSGLAPLLARRDLAPHAASTAPWTTTEAALAALRDTFPPTTEVSWHVWRGRVTETLNLIDSDTDVLLSPAGHFLAFRSRVQRNRAYRWYAVHVRTGAHLVRLGDYRLEDSALPGGAELDLSRKAFLDYLDAVERLPGRHRSPVDWGVAAVDLPGEIGRWRDVLVTHHEDEDVDHPYGVDHDCRAGLRELHRAAVLHALAAGPVRDATTETVQQVVVDLLDGPLPPVHDRDPFEVADHLRRFLVRLNGGHRRTRTDTRAPEALQNDVRTAEVVTLAVLEAFGGRPRRAVDALRTHASLLRQEQDPYAPSDRGEKLMDSALLIAELFSPAPTERQLLRHVTEGDVITFPYPNSADLHRPIERVVQVTGPVQYLELGLGNGEEQFAIPVADLTAGRPEPAVLLVAPGKPFTLHTLDESPSTHTLYVADTAVDRWAILPADAATLEHPALAARARAASRRAATAFDLVVTTTTAG